MKNNLIDKVADLILKSERILIITGAGISADSGLPTYRGIGGLYNGVLTDEGFSIEEALSGSMMLSRPDITWKHLWQIGSACRNAKPNRAHEVITLIQEIKPDTWVLTQNIDGFHKDVKTKNLIEIHGNTFTLYCTQCKKIKEYAELISKSQNETSFPPKCVYCGGIIRPKVVLFGEQLPTAAITKLYDLLDSRIDLVISIGTSGIFPYIVQPVISVNNKFKPTVEINPCITDISHLFLHRLEMRASEAMNKIWNTIINHPGYYK